LAKCFIFFVTRLLNEKNAPRKNYTESLESRIKIDG